MPKRAKACNDYSGKRSKASGDKEQWECKTNPKTGAVECKLVKPKKK